MTSLELETAGGGERALERVADLAALQFGQVFGEQVLGVESLPALREQAALREQVLGRVFPAEDTPMRVPAEVDRLAGVVRPHRA